MSLYKAIHFPIMKPRQQLRQFIKNRSVVNYNDPNKKNQVDYLTHFNKCNTLLYYKFVYVWSKVISIPHNATVSNIELFLSNKNDTFRSVLLLQQIII